MCAKFHAKIIIFLGIMEGAIASIRGEPLSLIGLKAMTFRVFGL